MLVSLPTYRHLVHLLTVHAGAYLEGLLFAIPPRPQVLCYSATVITLILAKLLVD